LERSQKMQEGGKKLRVDYRRNRGGKKEGEGEGE
jgi:hypothetical protein